MDCKECQTLERRFLESLIAADRAETALRSYFLTHQWSASVSDMAEYESLRRAQNTAFDERHRAYIDVVKHAPSHSGEHASAAR